MRLVVNGTEHNVLSPPLTPLLQVLREELFITSPKAGCQQGGCGACTVLVDGQPRRACLLPAAELEGAEVSTVEGLGSPEHLSPIQAAFNEHYAAQCGFCTSGFMMAAQALVEAGPVSRTQAAEALGGHICRCTGYVKILNAVTAAAAGDVVPEEIEADLGPQGEDAVTVIPGRWG